MKLIFHIFWTQIKDTPKNCDNIYQNTMFLDIINMQMYGHYEE